VQPHLQNLIDRSKIKVAAAVVADKTQDARAWIDRQRISPTKPITVRMELAKRALGEQVTNVRSKPDGLKQYRAVRITLATVNARKMPIQAAVATLAPLRKLATSAVKVALSVSHVGVALGVQKAKALLGGLVNYGKSAALSLAGGLASVASGVLGIGAMVGGAAVTGVGGLATYAIKLAADAEQARVSFTTMLGDAGKAKALVPATVACPCVSTATFPFGATNALLGVLGTLMELCRNRDHACDVRLVQHEGGSE
jgi:hypothetical protein